MKFLPTLKFCHVNYKQNILYNNGIEKVTIYYWLSHCTEDYEVLKRNFRNKSEEMETTTNKLKMQLKSAQSELEQTRNTLKSMEGSDGHGMLY